MAKKKIAKSDHAITPGKQLLAMPLIVFVTGVCLILLLTAGITNLVFLKKASQIQLAITADQRAEDYSRTISSYLEGHQKDLERLIAQPRIVNILVSRDPKAIALAEDEFKNAFGQTGKERVYEPFLRSQQL